MKEYKIDGTNKRLGRLASEIAQILRGKTSAQYVPYLMPENKVVVYNIDKIVVTGRKFDQKKYYHYSGYPGGMKVRTFKEYFQKDPEIILKKAVLGMLAKNKLKSRIIKNLIMHKGEEK